MWDLSCENCQQIPPERAQQGCMLRLTTPHNPKGPAARWAASRPDRGGSRDRRFNKRELSVRAALRRIRQNSPAPPHPRRGEPLWFVAFFCAKCGFTVRVGLTCRFGRCWTRPTGAQHRSSPQKVTLGSAARLQAPSLTPHCRYQCEASFLCGGRKRL